MVSFRKKPESKEGNEAILAKEGIYLGFAPTDNSPTMLGEMEIDISKQGIKFRHATGAGIDEDVIPLSEIIPMTREQVTATYKPGAEVAAKVDGFMVKSSGQKFMFHREPAWGDPALLVVIPNLNFGVLPPTQLFSPAQIQRGDYTEAMEALIKLEEEKGEGLVPRLHRGGKTQQEN